MTPHIYASGKNAQALKPHTDEYDVVIVHMAGRKVWHTCVPKSDQPNLSEAQKAEAAEMKRENIQGTVQSCWLQLFFSFDLTLCVF